VSTPRPDDAPVSSPPESLRRFVRRRGAVQTVAIVTALGTVFSIAAMVLVFHALGRTPTVAGLLTAALVPVAATPATLLAFLRLLVRLDTAEDAARRQLAAREQAERALGEREQRFRTVFERSADPILILEPSGAIIAANPAAVRAVARDGRPIAGSSFLDLGDRHPLEKLLADVATVGTVQRGVVLRAADGHPVDCDATAVFDDLAGGPVLVFLRDVGGQRELERTLRAARDAADAANRFKTHFVRNVSHDLRTPMQTIVGCAEAILARPSSDECRALASEILEESEWQVSLIEDLLDLARVESGRALFAPQPVDLARLTASVASSLTSRARANGNDLTVTFAPDAPRTVRADDKRLRRVLLNLVSNAVKFTTRGRVEITVSRAEGDDDRPRVFFAVADTGVGIDPAQQERIFRSFVQAAPSVASGGLGVGTTIARELVAHMGGEIGVLSVPGEGSTSRTPRPHVQRRPRPHARESAGSSSPTTTRRTGASCAISSRARAMSSRSPTTGSPPSSSAAPGTRSTSS
jgi:signal transduction histidine kinase